MICERCGGKVELGSAVNRDCPNCFVSYLGLRKEAESRGENTYPLSQESLRIIENYTKWAVED